MARFKLLLILIPFYPIYLIGEWYHDLTYRTVSTFSIKKETKEYLRHFKEAWEDVQ